MVCNGSIAISQISFGLVWCFCALSGMNYHSLKEYKGGTFNDSFDFNSLYKQSLKAVRDIQWVIWLQTMNIFNLELNWMMFCEARWPSTMITCSSNTVIYLGWNFRENIIALPPVTDGRKEEPLSDLVNIRHKISFTWRSIERYFMGLNGRSSMITCLFTIALQFFGLE
jgi:hypothetical protein